MDFEKDMKKVENEGHAPSYLPKGKNWRLVWSDEFDGTELDKTKWGFRHYFWGKKSPTFIGEEGLSFDGESHMRMNLVERDGDFYSCQLQTGSLTFDLPPDKPGFWPFGKKEVPKFLHRYGYYEVRCKQPKNDGWHAAFWLQAPGIGTHPDPAQCGIETDIMESYRIPKDGVVICGNGFGGYGSDAHWPGHFRVPFVETEDGWHYYGVDWSRDGYTFYVDGQKVGFQGKPDLPVSDVDEFILLTTEAHGYNRKFAGDTAGKNASAAGNVDVWEGAPVEELKAAVLPDCFEVDFVRVYDEE